MLAGTLDNPRNCRSPGRGSRHDPWLPPVTKQAGPKLGLTLPGFWPLFRRLGCLKGSDHQRIWHGQLMFGRLGPVRADQ